MIVGAAPPWFADNLLLIGAVVLGVVTILVLRVVTDAAARFTFLAVVVGIAVFLYANRVQLESCARTCECRIVRQDLTMPFCDPVDLSAPLSIAPPRV